MMTHDVAIGFDFGTSNSAIAVVEAEDSGPRLLRLDTARPDSSLVPTTLYFRPDGTLHIGHDAIRTFASLEAGRTIVRERQQVTHEIDTVYGREMVVAEIEVNQSGRFFQSLKRSLPDASFSGTEVFGVFFTPEDLIHAFLVEMRQRAEQALDCPVTRAMVGRPVHWSTSGKGDELALKRMETALRRAGFESFEFMPEPIAAGIRLASTLAEPQNVLVFDFGGGTLDVTVMRIGGDARDVLSTAGIPIGGDLLDEDVMDRRLLRYFGEHLRWGPQQLPMPQHILDTARRWYTIPELNDPEYAPLSARSGAGAQARDAASGTRSPFIGAWQPRLAPLSRDRTGQDRALGSRRGACSLCGRSNRHRRAALTARLRRSDRHPGAPGGSLHRRGAGDGRI